MKLLYTLVIVPLVLIGMEPMTSDSPKKNAQNPIFFGTDIPEKVAVYKRIAEPIMACKESELVRYKDDVYSELLLQSESWSTTQMSLITKNPLLEHQLWVSKSGFRFDNDTTHDCNELGNPLSNGQDLVVYDGPNNDVSPGQTGQHNGVILVGHSYRSARGVPQTVFHLFKQHGVDVKKYQGIQKKVKTNRSDSQALKYGEFPFTSMRLPGHTITLCAIASGRRGAITTVDEAKQHHLHVFDYTYEENTTDRDKPDQLFDAQIKVVAHNIPSFKRLAWLYGKTLLGITTRNELYVVAVNLPDNTSELPTITCIQQQTSKKFKDIALGRPDSHHELVLVDEQNQLYYTNLKDRIGVNGVFLLKKITEKPATHTKSKKQKVAIFTDKERNSEPWIDKVWMYGDKIGIMWAHQVYRLDFRLMRWPEEKKLQFLSLYQAGWNAAVVNGKLHELYAKHKTEQEKAASTNMSKKRSRKR